MKRVVKRWCLGTLAVVIIAVIVVWLSVDGIIRRTVASQSTASLNLQTRLDNAKLSIRGGHLSLDGLSIAAPEGFGASDMFTLKNAAVTVSYGQLASKPIHINQIVLRNPKLVIEHRNGRMNVLAAVLGMPKGESSEESSLRLIIDGMELTETTVVLRPGLPLLRPEYVFVLPAIALRDIGNADGAGGGAAIKDVLQLVLTAIMQKTAERGDLPMGVGALLRKGASGVTVAAHNVPDEPKTPAWKGLGDLVK